MIVRDNRYPSRVLLLPDGKEIQFKDHLAEISDKEAAELLQKSGDYEMVHPEGSTTLPFFSFRPSSWSKDKKLVWDSALGEFNGYGKSGVMIGEALSDVTNLYILNDGPARFGEGGVSEKIKAIASKELDKIDTYYLQYWPAYNSKRIADRQILYTMLEATRIPQSWVDNIHRSCERVIVPCEAQKKAFQDSGVEVDIEVIPLGIDTKDYPLLDRARDDDMYVFGSEGTLTYRKGIDIAIKAFKLAFPADKYPNVFYHIKTTQNAHPFYMSEIRDDKRFIFYNGWYTHEELLEKFYKAIDCYVFPSRGEGWGLSVPQAMATGLPVIGNDCGGFLQDSFSDKYGVQCMKKLVPVPNKDKDGNYLPTGYGPDLTAEGMEWWETDPEDVASAMLEVYNNKEKYVKKGKQGAKYIRNNFDVKYTARKIVEYLDRKF